MPSYKCSICSYSTDHKTKYTNHVKTHLPKEYKCEKCDDEFRTSDTRDNHMRYFLVKY